MELEARRKIILLSKFALKESKDMLIVQGLSGVKRRFFKM